MARNIAAWLILLAALPGRARAGVKEFTLTDHLRHDWQNEVVYFPVEFPPGACDGKHLALSQVWDGRRAPCQLIEVVRHPDGSVRRARLALVADLPERQSRTWRLEWGGTQDASPPASQLRVARDGEHLVLSSGPLAVRVPFGRRRCATGAAAAEVPGPLLGVKGPDGQWRGKGWLESPLAVEGYETTLLEEGPVLVACRVAYQFAGGKSYRVTVRLANGQNYAHVVEEADGDEASKFVFSVYAGFAPTHCVRPDEAPEPLGYREDRRLIRFFFNTYFHQVFDFKDWIGFFRNDAASKDYLGFVKIHGGEWTSPLHNAVYFLESRGPDVRLSASLRPARREWLVAMFDRTKIADLRDRGDHPGPLGLLSTRVGFVPLDEVKDMVLAWPVKNRPRAPASGDRQMAESLRERWGGTVRSALVSGLYHNVGAMTYEYAKGSMRDYGRVAGTGVLAADDERWVRAAMALLAYKGMSRDYFAWYLPLLPREDTADAEEPLQNWRYNFYMMNTNFDASRFDGVGEIALSLHDHPDFDKFLSHYKQCLRLHLDNTFSEDGFYHEDLSYMVYNLSQLAETMERMKREIGLDSFDEPRFKKGLWCVANLMTPPDPRYAGARTLPPFGDHDPSIGLRRGWGETLFSHLADIYADRDPELSGVLSWLWHHTPSGGTAPKVPPRPPALPSTAIRGWGAVLRSRPGTPGESYVLFRCDPFVGRFLNIENAFQLHARGCPLVVTPQGAGFEGDEPFGSLGRNKVSFNGNGVYEEWWGQLGVLEEFHSLGTCDYVRGFVRGDAYQHKGMIWSQSYRDKPYYHRRHLLDVHGDYYVLADEVRCDYPSDFTLNILADAVKQEGATARFTGRFAADLDVHFLAPAGPRIETKKAVMIVGPEYAKREPVLWLHTSAEPNQPWLTVLAPFVRGSETPPQVRRLGEMLALQVARADGTDYVFLSPTRVEWQSETLRFTGTRGMVRLRPRVEMTLLDAGTIAAGKTTLDSTAGGIALAAAAAGGWEGETSGGEKVVLLGGPAVREAQLDGKPLPWQASPAGAEFSLPAGHHLLRIR
ncbi:MAG: hypothetical protein ABSG86_17530 [Thermoguttaceae bacterium]|jgi:hypothetical protein